MAKYKKYNQKQSLLLPVRFHEQIIPGTFVYALNHIVDNELDLSVFDTRYKNDETGATAYNPSIMLKIILYAYSLGAISSRRIASLCESNIVFMALSADTRPHFTTIASFISSLDEEISSLFLSILLICSEEGLIGKHMFAIDGCKLSSNASKEWSGTREDFIKKKEKIEKSIQFIIKKHKARDKGEKQDTDMIEKEEKAIKNLRANKEKIDRWLNENEDKKGANVKPIKSNITDNESAKMVSSRGVLQGYNGIAVVDDKHQVVVNAEAFGSGSEHEPFIPMLDQTKDNFKRIGDEENVFKKTKVTADSGNHSEENMKQLFKREIEAYVADNQFRKRDPKFDTAQRHKKPIDKKGTNKAKKYFQPSDFIYDPYKNKLICPAGSELYVENSNFKTSKGLKGIAYRGKKTDCRVCKLKKKCMRSAKTEHRQVVVFTNKISDTKESFTRRMIDRFDTDMGRHIYSRRMGTVEPVFANIRNALGLDRFTLRGKTKVDIQWKLYCMVHNIGKIAKFGTIRT
jgi:transposase